MLRRIPLRLLLEWMEYAKLEPFGPEVESWRTATIAMILANVHRRKGQRPFRETDFMPRIRQQARKQTPEQMAVIFGEFARAHNAVHAARGARSLPS